MRAGMTGTAQLSPDGRYRYKLTREWPPDEHHRVVFVMLNPSTADAEHDDPTVNRCIGFAEREGAGGLIVLNAYALRSTDPTMLRRVPDPVGPNNDATLLDVFEDASLWRWPVIVAWGVHAKPERTERIRQLARAADVQLQCLGMTQSGAPRHPLYLRSSSELQPWPAAR